MPLAGAGSRYPSTNGWMHNVPAVTPAVLQAGRRQALNYATLAGVHFGMSEQVVKPHRFN